MEGLHSPNSASRSASPDGRAAGDRGTRPDPQPQPQLPLVPSLPAAPPAVAHKSIPQSLQPAVTGNAEARASGGVRLGGAPQPRRAHAGSHNAEDAVRAGSPPQPLLRWREGVGTERLFRQLPPGSGAGAAGTPATLPAASQRGERRNLPGPQRAKALRAPARLGKKINRSGSGGRSEPRPGRPCCRRWSAGRAGLEPGLSSGRAARPLWGRAAGGAGAAPSWPEAGGRRRCPQRRQGQGLRGTGTALVTRPGSGDEGKGVLLLKGFGEATFWQGQLCPPRGGSDRTGPWNYLRRTRRAACWPSRGLTLTRLLD